MTYKYTTVRIQRKEALLGYTVPKGSYEHFSNDVPKWIVAQNFSVCYVLIPSKGDSQFYIRKESPT